MNKNEFQEYASTIAYNMGFGAHKHFASYYLITKTPAWIGLITALVGLIQLAGYFSSFGKPISITLIFIGIISWSISAAYSNREEYDDIGKVINQLFLDMIVVLAESESADQKKIDELTVSVESKNAEFQKISLSKQIMFSALLAHITFFGKADIQWLDKHKNFHWWKDKTPANLKLCLLIIVIVGVLAAIAKFMGVI